VFTGRHTKGIALDMDLSVHTVREHLQRLYRHFDVQGREQLMARFIASDAKEGQQFGS
jgi:DNA-binding CsgD family transcriptional regulator